MGVHEGRWTSHVDGDFVVLLLGASASNPVDAGRKAAMMRRLVRVCADLERDPHRGLLGHQRHGGRRGVLVLYWRSARDMERLTRDTDGPDGDVWRPWFGAGAGGAPGFWNETFHVRAGEYEAAYHDAPAVGLLRAGVPAPSRTGP